MKKLLAKFKASNALDSNGAPTSATPTPRDGEVQQYENSLRALHQRLKSAPVSGQVPAGLHSATVRAVRTAVAKENAPRREVWRWLPAAGVALAVVFVGLGVLWLDRSPKNTSSTRLNQTKQPALGLTTALNDGHALAQTAPREAVTPLSNELELLKRDLQNTAKFVADSIP